jgi:hypothetical protein
MDSIVRQQTIPDGLLRHTVVLRQSPPAPVNFTAADTTQTIFLFGLPAKHVITGVVARLIAPFTAMGLSNCQCMIGGTSQIDNTITSQNFYLPAFTLNTPGGLYRYGPVTFGNSYTPNYGGNSNVVGIWVGVGLPPSTLNFFAGATMTIVTASNNSVVGNTTTLLSSGYESTTGFTDFTISTTAWNNAFKYASTVSVSNIPLQGQNQGAIPVIYWSPYAMLTTDPQDIKATFTSVGAQLANLTAGEVEFTVMYRPL